MKKLIGIGCILIFCSASASATTYKWVDDQGTLNFSEDPGNIPRKYRKKAVIIGEEEPMAEQVTEKRESSSGEKAPENTATKAGTPVEKQEKKKAVYGGKDENTWKSEFDRLRGEMKAVNDQLGSKRALIGDPSKLSRMQYKTLQYEIKNLEQRSNDLLAELKSLRTEAVREGVPAELQQ